MADIITSSTDASTGTATLYGLTTVKITGNALAPGEMVSIKGKDAAGAYTDTLHIFSAGSSPTENIIFIGDIQAVKSATQKAVAVTYDE